MGDTFKKDCGKSEEEGVGLHQTPEHGDAASPTLCLQFIRKHRSLPDLALYGDGIMCVAKLACSSRIKLVRSNKCPDEVEFCVFVCYPLVVLQVFWVLVYTRIAIDQVDVSSQHKVCLPPPAQTESSASSLPSTTLLSYDYGHLRLKLHASIPLTVVSSMSAIVKIWVDS